MRQRPLCPWWFAPVPSICLTKKKKKQPRRSSTHSVPSFTVALPPSCVLVGDAASLDRAPSSAVKSACSLASATEPISSSVRVELAASSVLLAAGVEPATSAFESACSSSSVVDEPASFVFSSGVFGVDPAFSVTLLEATNTNNADSEAFEDVLSCLPSANAEHGSGAAASFEVIEQSFTSFWPLSLPCVDGGLVFPPCSGSVDVVPAGFWFCSFFRCSRCG